MATTVTTSEYRRRLREWHERARNGEEIVVTEHGTPVVRVTAAGAEGLLEHLERDGLLRRSQQRRPADDIPAVVAPGDSTAAVASGRER